MSSIDNLVDCEKMGIELHWNSVVGKTVSEEMVDILAGKMIAAKSTIEVHSLVAVEK